MGEAAPFAARRVVEAASPFVNPGVLEELRLLISELVTNSVRHARVETGNNSWVEVRLNTNGDRIQAEVTDPGPGLDPPANRESNERTHGLYLLDKIASSWKVFHDGVNNHVTFEMENP
jgi:anti-sigma regulatory factor (Ser/Thr protein kinase)